MSDAATMDLKTKSADPVSLTQAFRTFQAHSERLESAHSQLRERLNNAELELAEKNEELARRIAQVRAISDRLTVILESIADPVLLVDKVGYVQVANPAALDSFGEAIVENPLSESIPELIPFLKENRTVRDGEICLENRSRPSRTVIVTVVPAPEGGEFRGSRIIVLKDVTEYRQLQEKLARENRLAALGKTAASVAHEIRNPLGAVEGFARLLQSDLNTKLPESEPLAEKIVHASHQVGCVVSNLLNFAREPSPVLDEHDLAGLINGIIQMLKPKAGDSGVAISLDADKEDIMLQVDAGQMRQVFSNLLVNAVEACPSRAGGRVSVALSESPGSVRVEVRDNGCGIEPEVMGRLFEPFFTMKDGGIGLGLSMCRKIVESHGGEISVAGSPGKETVFSVVLPKGHGTHDD